MAQGWQELTAAQRTAVKTDYASAGIKLIVAGESSKPSLKISSLIFSIYPSLRIHGYRIFPRPHTTTRRG